MKDNFVDFNGRWTVLRIILVCPAVEIVSISNVVENEDLQCSGLPVWPQNHRRIDQKTAGAASMNFCQATGARTMHLVFIRVVTPPPAVMACPQCLPCTFP